MVRLQAGELLNKSARSYDLPADVPFGKDTVYVLFSNSLHLTPAEFKQTGQTEEREAGYYMHKDTYHKRSDESMPVSWFAQFGEVIPAPARNDLQ